MKWLKTWLRKWLGIESDISGLLKVSEEKALVSEDHIGKLRNENSELRELLDALCGESVKVGVRIENLREHYASVKEMGEACMARLDRETVKLATAIDGDRSRTVDLFSGLRADLTEVIRFADRDDKRISELEVLVKDATLDTALSALEDRVAVIENHPAAPSTQGRRGGSAWNSHQVAAAAGAALANGVPNPIPTPGIS